MRTLGKNILLAGALLAPCLSAAESPSANAPTGPSLGLMVEKSPSAVIRPILGIPGAATVGTALSPGFAIDRAVVAPGGDFALAVAKGTLRVALVQASGAAQWLTPATGEAPDLIVFSPRGSSAALYYRASGRLAIASALRTQTPVVASINAASVPVAPSMLAVSEDAASLLLAAPEGASAALYYLSAATSGSAPSGAGFARRLGTFESVSALRFAGSGSDALLADGTANSVYLIQNVPGAAQIGMLGSARDGLSRPQAVEAMDARRVLVVNAGSQDLTILSRDGTPAAVIHCGCSPALLHQLAGTSVYRLTEASQGPMWLLDAGGAEARIVAVPPDVSQSMPARVKRGARQ